MSRQSRHRRFREICAPWLVSGLAMSVASAIWLPLASVVGSGTPESRARGTAKASAQIREAVRIELPNPTEKRSEMPRGMPATVQRSCRAGDVPEGTPCTLNIVDLP